MKSDVDSKFIIQTRAGDLNLSGRARVMGILNVTPDSFSDGGKFISAEAAIARAEVMAEEGAEIVDVGGESTRPGAAAIPPEEELRRVVPIVEILAQRLPRVPISVDTRRAEVARRALDAGASIINDISALRSDPQLIPVLKEHGVPVVLMHMQGSPETMQIQPRYGDVVAEINEFFQERLAVCAREGMKNQIILDPGIGFGKTQEQNLEILRRLAELDKWGHPILIGTSRKSFLGRILEGREETVPPPQDRLEGSLASGLWAAAKGARIVRVHDVKAMRRALDVWAAIAGDSAGW